MYVLLLLLLAGNALRTAETCRQAAGARAVLPRTRRRLAYNGAPSLVRRFGGLLRPDGSAVPVARR